MRNLSFVRVKVHIVLKEVRVIGSSLLHVEKKKTSTERFSLYITCLLVIGTVLYRGEHNGTFLSCFVERNIEFVNYNKNYLKSLNILNRSMQNINVENN